MMTEKAKFSTAFVFSGIKYHDFFARQAIFAAETRTSGQKSSFSTLGIASITKKCKNLPQPNVYIFCV